MKRDAGRLAAGFDLLVVGGGIYGLMVTWEASLRGLRTALVERHDFGGGTSFNSARTVHGGVRSLQRLALTEMHEYVAERRILATIAPHLVHPLPFVMAATRSLTANPVTLRLYFEAYARLTASGSQPRDHSKRLPRPRPLGRAELLALNPYLEPRGVVGGMEWHDGQLFSSERLAIALARGAHEQGAVVCNYVEAEALLERDGRVSGVRARDLVTGEAFDIVAAATVNAAGPRSSHLLTHRRVPLVPAWSKAMNLVVPRRTSTHAVAGGARGRLYFLAPWRDMTIAGTSHDPFDGDVDATLERDGDVAAFVSDLNQAFPRLGLRETDAVFVHRGLLPSEVPSVGTDVRLLRDSLVVNHATDGRPGLWSVVGVRYTTARATARKAVDAVAAAQGLPLAKSTSDVTPLPGGDIDDYRAFEEASTRALSPTVGAATALRMTRFFGRDVDDLRRGLDSGLEARGPLSASCQVTKAEVVHAARHEMVVTLEDVLIRRLDAAQTGGLDAEAVAAASHIVGGVLGWSDSRRVTEADRTMRRLARR